uniref:Laminin EGF-like domain-containing protein n=1 Tax=Heligmosomoides polygyrus TaxID=6339 RepID=A0A183F1U3_HELPZ
LFCIQGFREDVVSFQNNIEIDNGVTIQFQLRGYSNPQSSLPNGWTCVCPTGFTCSYLNTPPSCYFSFTFIVSAPECVFAAHFTTTTPPTLLRWMQAWVTLQSAIDIFAHNLGAVINQADGTLVSVDTLTHADTFVVPLSDAIPAVGGVQSMSQQHTYQGKLLGTTLMLSYSISCTGPLIGPNCDLTCTTSMVNSNTAACRSNDTGFYYVCSYATGGQVSDCKSCPWGIKDDTYCQDQGGGVLDPYTAVSFVISWKNSCYERRLFMKN